MKMKKEHKRNQYKMIKCKYYKMVNEMSKKFKKFKTYNVYMGKEKVQITFKNWTLKTITEA